jgi:hypothetical protein
MTSAKQTEKEAARIADAIVDLVEHSDGPVPLTRLDREIAGFAQKDEPSWQYMRGKWVIWEGMTETGYLALQKIISGRLVAVQSLPASPLSHLFGCPENWQPIALHPARAANVDGPNILFHWPQADRDAFLAAAAAQGKRGYRPLDAAAA